LNAGLTPGIDVHPSREQACRALAREIAELLRAQPAAVLGFPTGESPVPLYRELVRLHREEGLSFARARSFNLDEYVGLPAGDPRAFRAWMQRQLFDGVDFAPGSTQLPRAQGDAELEARRYADALAAAGGIDLQLVGIGRNGHVGFNEPGSARDSRTRVVELAPETRAHVAAGFGGLAQVPERAITLGVADILDARAIRVLAFGAGKADIVRRMLEGPIGPDCPASFLRGHRDLRLVLDEPAAAGLRR
jgi:glucosamine-6-phosphate deaminase